MALNLQLEIDKKETSGQAKTNEETELLLENTSPLQNKNNECDSSVSFSFCNSLSNPDIQYSSSNSCFEEPIAVDSDDNLENTTVLSEESSASSQSPKRAFQNTKQRAGVLYKKLKCNKTSSKYFNQAHNNTQKKWIPPRSPYSLVQEDLFDQPWQLLVATIFLTKTKAKRALPHLHKFLAKYPRPEDVLQASYEDIDEYFKPLGLTSTRTNIVMRFTLDYLQKDWTYPRELYGIGKYGDDSYRMFCVNEWRQVAPDDIPLTMYRNWLLENADRLGII